MALLNASGKPVAVQVQTFQIDIPAEAAASIGVPDIFSLIGAVMALIAALATGNPIAIINAIQAFIKALIGS